MVDRNKPLKLESWTGGSSLDLTPTETNPSQDGLDARAYFVQNDISADSSVVMSRTGGDLTLTDPTAGTKRAQDLVSRVRGAQASHQALADLIHMLDEGPGDGWASGACCRVVYNGILPSSRTWATDSSFKTPIVSVTYAYQTQSPLLASKTWRMHQAGQLVVTLVDTYAYSGPVIVQVTRTWS